MKTSLQNFKRCRSGAVAPLFALSSLALFGATSGAVQYSAMAGVSASLQAATDAAAAAVTNSPTTRQRDHVARTALLAAFSAKFADGTPTLSTSSTSDTYTLTASVKVKQIFPFISAESGFLTVSASSQLSTSTPPSGPPCILLKDPAESPSLSLSDNASISAQSCELDVASTDSDAADLGMNAGISVANFCVAGDVSSASGSMPANTSRQCKTKADPFPGRLTAPSTSGCTVGGPGMSTDISNGSLSPGIYCGSINISATTSMSAGTYVLVGSVWQIAPGTILTGDQVTIYFADSDSSWQFTGKMSMPISHPVAVSRSNQMSAQSANASPQAANASSQPMYASESSTAMPDNSYRSSSSDYTVQLTAPKSGAYAGLLMFEADGLDETDMSLAGSSTLTGLVYLPSRDLEALDGSSLDGTNGMTLVSNTLALDSGVSWNVSPQTSFPGGVGGRSRLVAAPVRGGTARPVSTQPTSTAADSSTTGRMQPTSTQ